jgi:cell division protein FtsB
LAFVSAPGGKPLSDLKSVDGIRTGIRPPCHFRDGTGTPRDEAMKLGRRFIMIILLVMGFLILFGKKGLVDNYKMRQKVADLSTANQQMQQENSRLKQEILLLRKDTKYIERLARDELGMVKKGDIIYRISEESRP